MGPLFSHLKAGVPTVALTATLTRSALQQVTRELSLSDPLVVVLLSDRSVGQSISRDVFRGYIFEISELALKV